MRRPPVPEQLRSALRGAPDQAVDCAQKNVEIEWFGDTGTRTKFRRRGRQASIGGHDNHGRATDDRVPPERVHKLPTVHDRHHEVQDDSIGAMSSNVLQSFRAVCGCADLVTVQFERLSDDRPDRLFIIDDKDAFRVSHSATERRHRGR